MNNELLNFRRKLSHLGLCGDYSNRWSNAQNKLDLVRMSSDPNGAQTMCDSYAFGYNMPTDYIRREFGDYINNGYVIAQEGYTSAMYFGYNGDLTALTTLVVVLDSNCTINVPEGRICRIFVAKSKVKIQNYGECEVELYTSGNQDCGVIFDGPHKDKITINSHTTSEWRK